MAVSDIVGGLTKGYLYTHLAKDGARLWKRLGPDLDVDTDALLRRVGMSRYAPGKRALGGVGFLLLGAAVGAVVALALAPKPGVELRADVRGRTRELFERARNGLQRVDEPEERHTHA
jgi:hypothetical protein